MGFWNTLRIGASALASQRLRLDIISNNIANAETTKTSSGGPYQRQDVVFRPEGERTFLPYLMRMIQHPLGAGSRLVTSQPAGVKVAKIITDQEPGPVVYDPTHPDADENGNVQYPNVNLVVEMTNMISATRSYEANLSMIAAAKRMAQKALEIGR